MTLLISATIDDQPQFTLAKLLHEISQANAASFLNPLDTLPLLLSCVDQAAQDILSLMGECSAPKEVIIAVQEAIEHVESSLDQDDIDEEKNLSRSLPNQIITLVGLYASSIPRLKLRRQAASDTIRPLLSELETTIRLAGARCSRDEGRGILSSVSHLVRDVAGWMNTVVDVTDEEISARKLTLKSVLDCVTTACAHCLQTSLTQRCFETYFPRLTLRSSIELGWEKGHEAVLNVINSYTLLGISPISTLSTPTTGSMVLLAHSAIDDLEVDRLLLPLLPTILASIQSNSTLDEALAILLKTLHPRDKVRPEWSPHIIIPLCTVLPSLCSSHPDPLVRHQTFRCLSLLLSSTPPPLRLQLLQDLTTDWSLPQMCVASVGLVKEAFLEGISSTKSNIFASPIFLQVFGSVLLRPNPPDLFSSSISLEEFKDSSEPSRLIECLALYYIVLVRDKSNKTGIRDPAMVRHVEKTLLSPVRSALTAWIGDWGVSNSPMHDIMPLISLQLGLQRVDGAKAEIFDVSAA